MQLGADSVMPYHGTSSRDLEALLGFDSCTLANAIELLNVRLRNEGYANGDVVKCLFPNLPPVAGYAVTARMRSSSPPVDGHCYYDHIEWWRHLETMPAPRIVVMLDADNPPGSGALFGSLHARICMAMHCVAFVTNGAVRDLPGIERLGFQLFASGPAVSHAYAHVVDFGNPVEIGGLTIRPGDLLHADLHGILSIPAEEVSKLPALAARLLHEEQDFIRVCIDGDFSLERLANRIREHAEAQKCK